MKILLISGSDMTQPYGATTRPHYIAKNLAKLGCEILHICLKPPTDEDCVKYLSKEYYAEKTRHKKFVMMIKDCMDFAPDIIYAHQFSQAKLGVLLKYLLNKPFVYDAHSSVALELPTYSDLSWSMKTWLRFNEWIILKLADKVIVVSKELKDFLYSEYNIQHKKLNIVKNGVETDVFKPANPDANIKKKWELSGNDKIIAFTNPRIFSFPSNEVALQYFFEMIPKIELKLTNIKFLILGGGQNPKPPSKNVIYTGFVEDLPAYLNLADVCIAPFPPEAVCGGTRNKVNEYFACGKAVISTIEGMRGFDDAISGKHYLLSEDKNDFIYKLVYCIENPEETEKLGRNARELSLNYDWNILSREINEILKETLDNRNASDI